MANRLTGQQVTAAKAAPKENPLLPNARLRQIYAAMLQGSLLDRRLAKIAKKRKLAADYVSSSEREAIVAGAVIGLRAGDWLAPLPGDLFSAFVKGVPLPDLLTQFYGKTPKPSDGNSGVNLIPPSTRAADRFEIAIGIALANRAAANGDVVMVFASHLSPTTAEWREAANFAAAHRLPILFVIENSLPEEYRKDGGGDKNSLQSADYYLPVFPVDAQDVVAMYRVAYESLHKARTGRGPTLIEARTLNSPNPGAALDRIEQYLLAKKLFSPKWKQGLIDKFSGELEDALEFAKNAPGSRSPRD